MRGTLAATADRDDYVHSDGDMKHYHAGYRYVLLAYATPVIGLWASVMVHTNPINEVEVLTRIVTSVLGTWFVARGFYTLTKPNAPEGLGVLIFPALVLCLIMWAMLLIGHVLRSS